MCFKHTGSNADTYDMEQLQFDHDTYGFKNRAHRWKLG